MKLSNEQVISLLQSGDMFPHVGFFDRSPYPATAEAVQETELIVIRIADFDDLLMKYPQMTIKVMEIMGKKIIDLQERIQGFISKDVQHRLTHALMKLAAEHGVRKGKGCISICRLPTRTLRIWWVRRGKRLIAR
ncbi:Crp/Fnr family transcriptional regulator [Bacillus sonorensis]|nr:Crp/Fnr family transcriptional regulator [Bacillus sonorensis]